MDTFAKYFILIVFFLTACRTNEYYYTKGYNYSDYLILNKDNSFVQYILWEGINDTFYGTWEKRYDTLNLSITKPELNFIDTRSRVEEYYLENIDSIKIAFYINDDNTNVTASIYPNKDKNVQIFDKSGVIYLPSNYELNSFAATYLYCPSIEYDIKDKNSNFFKVYLYYYKDGFKWTRINVTKTWLRKNRKLYPIDEKTKKVRSNNRPLKKKIFSVNDK